MSVTKSAIAWILSLVAFLAVAACGDNIIPRDGGGPIGDPGDSSKEITKFTINSVDGTITGTSIGLTLPFGTDLHALTPTIEFTGANLQPGTGVTRDFSGPASYQVTAVDGSTIDYTVTVTAASSSAKDITQFTINGVDGVINGTNISLTLPFGTAVTSLTPAITITGTSVSPASGVAQDFTNPVAYTVTAADGSTKAYTATVSVAANSAKDITQFTVLGINGTITGTNISLTVPFGTSLTSLTPTIVITGVSVNPASGAAHDFTSAVTYVVTAADGSTKSYTVTVTAALNSAKDITQFTVLGVNGTIGATTISVTLPFGTNITDLTPTVTITGTSVSPASGVAHDFTSPVTYTVTAADGTTKTYTVTVTAALNSAKDITQFTVLGVNGAIGSNTVSLTLPFGTNLTNLTPTIAITGASVSPASGVPHDFTSPVTYTVTAADGSTKAYTVSVSLSLNSAKDITKFTILGVDGVISGTNISLTLPFGTNLTSLTPTIAITGVSVSPNSGAAHDFSSATTYTVTAADGSTKAYTVMVSAALNSAKDITKFTILGVDGTINGTNISLTLPFGTNLTNLTPTIIITGVSVSPTSGATHDFTSAATYTVTASDGSTKVYTVAVTAALNSAKDITQFTINGVNGSIGATTIALTLPFGVDLTNLTPTITHTGVSVSPGSGVAQNFSTVRTYTVTAGDGSTKDYAVKVTVALSSAKDITQFTILGVNGTIGANTISLTLPFGTNLTSLTPTITITGTSVSPASNLAQNFSAARTYTVTAMDGSMKSYTVTVTAAPSSSKDITAFSILGVAGVIGTNTISLTVPFGTNLANLTPTITHTGASILPNSGTAQNFTSNVVYTVKAADNSTKAYTVTVSVAPSTAKDITDFTILGIPGTIGATTISLTVPFGTSLTSLTPTITITGVSVSPASNTAQNFTSAVTYTVTAMDGSTKDYAVTVGVAPSSAKDITQFTILGTDGTIGANTISLTLPFGTPLTSLTPTIVHTGVSVSPTSGSAQDFSVARTYTVTAMDGTTKDYTVTVATAPSSSKDITAFTILGIDGVIGTNTITLTVPFGTDRTSLTPTITHTGASILPNSGVAQNFTSNVVYTVTAADNSTKAYTVTVSVAPSSAKDITDFTILGIPGTVGTNTIALTVPFGTSLTSLTPTVAITGVSVSPASNTAQNFTSAVTYTVTAMDGSTKDYTVTVGVAPSTAKDIIQFTILGVDGVISGTDISLTLPYGTSLTSLTPTIVHTGVSVSPTSGAAQNFSSPVDYTVTAMDGSTQTYAVTVATALNSAKDITQFTILGIDGTISANSIAITLPFGTDPSSLTPTVMHTGASVSPNSGVAQNFSAPVTYTVTAADSSTKSYLVTVTVAANSAKDITQFTILGVDGDISANTITLKLPFGTDRTSLVPTIVHTGDHVTPNSGVAQNFSAPFDYVVTAADNTTKTYTVTVDVALDSSKDITQFTILGVDGTIVGTDITLTVPFGTSLASLTPTITITGVAVSPNSGSAQNFTASRVYTVVASDGSTKDYTVTVTAALNSAKDITQFTVAGVDGVIGTNTIAVTLPFGTNVTSLTPTTIAITGVSVSPSSGVARDFTAAQTYTVTAADNSTKTYTVTVTVAQNSAKDITSFSILGFNATIGTNTVTLVLPANTVLTALSPTITINGVSVTPASGVTRDFTTAQTYTVTAADGSTKTYIATVTTALSSDKDILSFIINGADATITGSSITLVLPANTNLTALVPTITHNGASISPASGVAQNFSVPVNYTVTAADGSTRTYTVTVTLAPPSGKEITRFRVGALDGVITNSADGLTGTVTLNVPSGTSLSSITPIITINGVSITPASGVARNFTTSQTYVVTAVDGSTRTYTVTIGTVNGNGTKLITDFIILGHHGSITNGATSATIIVHVPTGTDLSLLTPTIIANASSVNTPSFYPRNFTGPVTYTATAANNGTRVYTVTVIADL
ncbi:MAG TPA: DUF5018 domain-containing protein [Kofleriaceae bacterium]|jgi:hypothetical protein